MLYWDKGNEWFYKFKFEKGKLKNVKRWSKVEKGK